MPFTFCIHSRASQDRLEKLIAERLATGADKAAIDRRIWNLFGEKWAVMYTDLAGFSRRVAEFGIVHFLQTIYESHRLLVPVIERHCGILLKPEGDSLLVIFRQVDEAVGCALDMQAVLDDHNRTRIDAEKVLLCVGIGYGDVLRIGDADVFGAEVNAACKLGEDTAQAGDIFLTGNARRAATAIPGWDYLQLDTCPAGADAAFSLVNKNK